MKYQYGSLEACTESNVSIFNNHINDGIENKLIKFANSMNLEKVNIRCKKD